MFLRWASAALACLSAAFAVYGSLHPFDFASLSLDGTAEAIGRLAGDWRIESRSDAVANLLLFMPTGFFGAGVWDPSGRGLRPSVAVGIVAACLLLSLMLEIAQTFLPTRTTSVSDVMAHGLGTALGLAAWSLAGSRAARWLAGAL